MQSIRLKRIANILLMFVCFATSGCDSVPESRFELAEESRLPKWFVLPPGLSRSDVTVTLEYYINSSGRTARFILRDKNKQKITEVTGTQKGLQPITIQDTQSSSSFTYPLYEVVTANAVTEIIEHRQMEPKFYITDDPVIWKRI